jgi:diguanylate cyclase (GGDEF)-like protein
MEVLASFGDEPTTKMAFPLDECWAMRRNQVHLAGPSNTTLVCNHLLEPQPQEYLCVPLAAQGQMVGMLHVGSHFEGKLLERQKKLAVLMGEQIALALANLRLRESLRNQSIRDALTGLYNRRYMEEQLEKEVNRSGRDGRKLSALMIDIDHFKEFNDRHGHAAGDTVLGSVGTLLNRMGRKSDLTCRYGGEELVVLFPETRLEDALALADRLRLAIKELALEHRGQPLGPVTVSVGVATCPDDGKTAAELLRAADIALYHAKAMGRDRVSAWRDIPEAKDTALPESPGGAGFFIHTANSPDGTNGKFL